MEHEVNVCDLIKSFWGGVKQTVTLLYIGICLRYLFVLILFFSGVFMVKGNI